MNVFTFTGRLAADAELRSTQGGDKVLGFRVANDIGFDDRKTTNWIDCAMWGQRGEKVAQFLTKGTQVCVSGEVTLREYQTRDGSSRSSMAVRVNDVTLLGGRQDDQRGGGRPSSGGGNTSARTQAQPRHDDFDDEIPF